MTNKTTLLLAALATLTLATSADAQVNIGWGGGSGGGGFVTIGGGGRPIGLPNPGWRPNRRIVTKPTVTHVDPWTNTIHTQNHEVFESVNDYGRDASRNNGTMRRVNRPIFDNFGNLVGYEQGVEWRNSLTGQRHHETVKTTVNGAPWGGGVINNTNSSRSYGAPVVNNTISTRSVQSSHSRMAPQTNQTHSFRNQTISVGAPAP